MSVQSFAALSMILVGGVTLVVGVRLLALAWQTRKLAEFAFGMSFVSGSVGTALAQVGQRTLWADAGTLATILNGLCFGLAVTGTFFLYLVVWRVFRPDRIGAAALCVLGSAAGAVAFGMRVSDGTFTTLDLQTPGLAVFQIDRLVLFTWSAYEGLRQAAQLRRRVRLGLADPVVATQIGLWGISGLMMLPVTVAIITFVLGYSVHPLEMPVVTAMITALTLATGLAMWCAFFPPMALRSWAARRADSPSGVATRSF